MLNYYRSCDQQFNYVALSLTNRTRLMSYALVHWTRIHIITCVVHRCTGHKLNLNCHSMESPLTYKTKGFKSKHYITLG